MSRNRLALGAHGTIDATPQRADEHGRWKRAENARSAQRWRARVHVMGFDGITADLSVIGTTKRDALHKMDAKLAERLKSGSDVTMTAATRLSEAAEMWLAQIARTDSGLSHNTIVLYSETVNRHVLSTVSGIAGLTLAELNSPQRLRSYLQRVADRTGTATAKTVKSVVSGILNLAVSNGVLSTNAMREIRPVKRQTEAKPKEVERDHGRAFTRAQRDEVVAYAASLAGQAANPRTQRKRETVALLVGILAGLGVRIAEARSLIWSDVDLVKGTVRVRGTKTTGSDRVLNFPGWLLAMMRVRAERVGTDGLVLPSPGHSLKSQTPWDRTNCNDELRAILDNSGFAWAIPHTFRRTVATLLHEQGAPLVRISDQLGHADPSMTARVYLGRDLTGDKSALADLL